MKLLSESAIVLLLLYTQASSAAEPYAPREELLNNLGFSARLLVQDKIEIPAGWRFVVYQGGQQVKQIDFSKPFVRIFMKRDTPQVRYLGPSDASGNPRTLHATGFVSTGVPGSILFMSIPTGNDRSVSHVELVVPAGRLMLGTEPAGTVADFKDAMGTNDKGLPRIELQPSRDVPVTGGDPSIASSSNPKLHGPLEHVAAWAGDGAIQAN